jgi:hypothetical protein
MERWATPPADSRTESSMHNRVTVRAGATSALLVGALALLGCPGDRNKSVTGTKDPVVTSLSVLPSTLTLTVGGTQQLAASVLDASGAPMPGRPVTFVSSNLGVATVSGGGARPRGSTAGSPRPAGRRPGARPPSRPARR